MPQGCGPLSGDVTGFIASGAGLPTVYVSRDNPSIDIVRDILAVKDRRYNAETGQGEDSGKTVFEGTVSGEQTIHFATTVIKGARLVLAVP